MAHARSLVLLIMLATGAPAQLAGLYTVNPAAPAGGGNYGSLAAAVADLMALGVAGPVVFELFDDGGPFTDPMPFATTNVTWDTSDAVLVLGSWAGASPTNRVTFRAAAGEYPVLDATGRAMGVFFNGADFVTLEALDIHGATFDAVTLYSEAAHGQVLGARIRRCRLHDCGGAGVVVYGNLPHPQDTRVENNFLWNLQTTNAGGFNTLARFAYVTTRRSNGTVVAHNTFWVGTAAGQFFGVVGSFPGSYTDTPITELVGNVVHKTAGSGQPILRFLDIGGVSSVPLTSDANCWSHPAGGPLAVAGAYGATTLPDLAAWRAATGLDTQSIDTDPMLAGPLAGDLHLLPSSPCIDSGPIQAVPDDIDGQLRVVPDMGADELGSTSIPRVSFVGTSLPHSSGNSPVMGTNQLPALGTSAFTLGVTAAPSGEAAFLFWANGVSSVPLQLGHGNLLWLDLQSFLDAVAQGISPVGPLIVDSAGTATVTFSIGADPALAGFAFAVQAAITDGANGSGFVTTNALDLLVN